MDAKRNPLIFLLCVGTRKASAAGRKLVSEGAWRRDSENRFCRDSTATGTPSFEPPSSPEKIRSKGPKVGEKPGHTPSD